MSDKKKRFSVFVILILFVFLALFAHFRIKEKAPISKTAFKLNTVVTITIYDSSDESLLTEALALCDRYEKLFSRTLKTSELYKLNHQVLPEKDGFYDISPETASLIQKGLEYSSLSDGAFDLSIAPVSSLWDFTSEEKIVPSKDMIEKALPLVGYEKITLKKNAVKFETPGMGLDLGAIAKGYIADRIKEFLKEKGVKSATINLGGNILCIGAKPDGTPFRVGIQKPFADRSETIASVDITDRSVVSSGIYERYFKKDGTLYHHILNPKTGYPYQNSLVSVTIISDKSVDGDALSTSCFSLGLEKGMELINRLPDTEAVFITDDNQLHYSKNFHKKTIQ